MLRLKGNSVMSGILPLLNMRSFGRQHLSHYSKRERKWMDMNEAHMKNFTKNENFKRQLKEKKDAFK